MVSNYEISYISWRERWDPGDNNPNEYSDSDPELDKIFENIFNEYKDYYRYSYLGSDKLQSEIIDMQNWLPSDPAYSGWFELRRETVTADRFFKLCSEINKTADADISKYKNRLYKLVNSECSDIQNDF